MFDWLRSLARRLRSGPPDPVADLERERRLRESQRELDRFKDGVLEDQQHYVTRHGGGGLPPPRGD